VTSHATDCSFFLFLGCSCGFYFVFGVCFSDVIRAFLYFWVCFSVGIGCFWADLGEYWGAFLVFRALGFLQFWVLWVLHAGFRVGPYGFVWVFLFMG
jgi:hypothetical protein